MGSKLIYSFNVFSIYIKFLLIFKIYILFIVPHKNLPFAIYQKSNCIFWVYAVGAYIVQSYSCMFLGHGWIITIIYFFAFFIFLGQYKFACKNLCFQIPKILKLLTILKSIHRWRNNTCWWLANILTQIILIILLIRSNNDNT